MMRGRFRLPVRPMALAAGALALAAWILPTLLSTERYRHRLELGLEQFLHRPVTFGRASFRLLPRPGVAIEDAVVREDPAFGAEPFARIDHIECDLRWRSLWRTRLEFARLKLERPNLNIVRTKQGEWNIESLLVKSGLAGSPGAAASNGEAPPAFEVAIEDARLNFKIGADKKPFAIVELGARLNLDPARGRIQFRLAGNPVRSDLPLPTPGKLELEGEWRPGDGLGGVLDARLRTRDALLYNWIPLLSGYNPEIYGVLDSDTRIQGSLRVMKFQGDATLAQVHRADLIPPAGALPVSLRFRGEFDRNRKRALLESVEATLADSRLHLSGAVEQIPESPALDLVVALERARLEDLQALSRRLWRYPAGVQLAGRVDGLLSVQGPWRERRYGGFLGARDMRLSTSAGSFPVSELALRIDRRGARLAPVTVSLAPRLGVTVEGAVYPAGPAPKRRKGFLPARYELKFAAKSFELNEVIRFARSLGIASAQRFDGRGIGTASFTLTGTAWPPARPTLAGKGEIRAARFVVPGLTEPLNVPRATVQANGDHLVASPLTAVMGTSVFTGRLEHQGARSEPWHFDLRANALSVEQGALWFDVLGLRPPLALLDRLPGLNSQAAQRSAASGLFSLLNARGRFATPLLTYRSLTFKDFQATIDLAGRILRVAPASFQAGGGRGQGKAELNLTASPAAISGEVTMAGVRIPTLAGRLPPALRQAHGLISGTARFQTRGLSRSEMGASLQADGKARLEKVTLGDFDPLLALSRQMPGGTLEPARGEVAVRPAEIEFTVRDRRINFARQRLDIEGARLNLSGSWGFNSTLDFAVEADLRHAARRWTSELPADPRISRLRISGPMGQLVLSGEGATAQARR